MASDQEMRAVVERIETLVEGLARSADATTARRAQELVRLLMRLYGAGLTRMLGIVRLHEGEAGRTLRALLDDDLVSSLLVLHDLHPEDVETRLRRGLDRLQHATGATLVLSDLRDGVARVNVKDRHGAGSASDLQRLIEGVIRALAPEVSSVEIAGLPTRAAPPLVQISRGPAVERPNGATRR